MRRHVWSLNNSLYLCVKTAAKLGLYPFFQLKTSGLQNLPRAQAFILLPKHQRWEDIPLLGLAARRPLYYMAKYELFLNPLLNWFLASLGGIPLNRARPLGSRPALKMMIELLKNGDGIVIFPEGTYYKDHMGPGHAGLIRMVRSRLRLPFIPVGIRYTRKRVRTQVHVRFGKAIYARASDKVDELLRQVLIEIAGLSGLAQRN